MSPRRRRRKRKQPPPASTEPGVPPPSTTTPPVIDPALARAMSLRVPGRGGTDRRLTGAEVENALLSGEHAQTLSTYFGEAEYAELRELAARATQRRARGGPRVLILPGILGSMLGRVRGNSSRIDTIWIDFFDILLGHLADLRLPDAGRTFRAFDVHHATYLRLKLTLRAEGFDADFHPFDWRQSIPSLGRELAARIAAEPANEIHLVAHSMGGLVARAALDHDGIPKMKRLIMLGTPNFGSFAPVMVFRGVYRFLRLVALLDLGHSADQLAGRVFNTFPGLAEMMPQRSKFSAVDLYDLQQWPAHGPRPLQSVIEAVPAAQAHLAIDPARFTMIAGVDRDTVVGLRAADGEFIFEKSNAGDGTVPLELARLPDVPTFFHPEGHGELPKNATIQRAVVQLLRDGATSLLADHWESTRANVPVEISEAQLREQLDREVKRRAGSLTAADLRELIAEFAAPSTPTAPTIEGGVPAGLAPLIAGRFESLVIGRQRQRRIDITLVRGSLTQVRARAYVLGLFENVAPSGAAGAIDALMDGAVTEFRQRRMYSSAIGEMFALPGGRHDVMADHIVFVGLGSFDGFGLPVLRSAAENLARTLVRLDIEEIATVPIGAGTGLDIEPSLQALLRGFFAGLADADPDHGFRRIILCELDEARYEALRWSLFRLASTGLFADVEITLTEKTLPPAAVTRRSAVSAFPASIYLDVRCRVERTQLVFESSLLTTGAKATVLSGEKRAAAAEVRQLLDRIETARFDHDHLPEFGRELAALVLDESIIAGIAGCSGNHVIVVHDAEASRIPWETLSINGEFPALAGGMSRRYIAENLSVAKWLEQRRDDAWLDVLLVVDPREDLPGAREEGARINALFNTRERIRLTRIDGRAATRERLRSEISSGRYDLLHYAGHAFFDPAQVSRSGVLCHDGVLSGAELTQLDNLPAVVFFNACEAGRIRKPADDAQSRHRTRDVRQRLARSVGLAEAFLRGGVANYVGTYWPVGDASASAFAAAFYEQVLAGGTLATAMQEGRKAVNAIPSVDWADYIFYGSLDFRVKSSRASG